MTTTQQRIVSALKQARERVEQLERMRSEPIAIVGMGCRLPSAIATPGELWQTLTNGVDATSEIPAERWDVEAFYDPDPDVPGKMYTRRGGFLSEVDKFDPGFFGISAREAASMDPQQRLLLEVTWEALEDAAISAERIRGSSTGVFMGVSWHDYERLAFGRDPNRVDAYAGLGNTPSIAVGRIAYVLGVHGPTMLVDTACSASLVAVHTACQSLRAGECSMALAGGVALMLSPLSTVFCCKIRALSPSGRCRTFDANADGYARGEGCGVVVLKRLSDALSAGDRIQAVIRGTAINHDGPSSGLTVPNGRAQERLIEAALRDAAVDPADVDYVEAHGTGTRLGDPIEVSALAEVYGRGRHPDRPLHIASLKTNIGHLEAAAGVAGLIKTVLMLQHGQIPPHLNCTEPSPRIDWQRLPVRVPGEVLPWSGERRIAGVSSFGFSGTNAHVIVESAPIAAEPIAEPPAKRAHVLSLSARSEEALRALAGRYGHWLASNDGALDSDLCFSASTGRSTLEQRAAWVFTDKSTLRERLLAFASSGSSRDSHRGVYRNRQPRLAFLFTGQGSHYAEMGRELFEQEPTFRAAVLECAELLRSVMDVPLQDLLYGRATAALAQTAYAQPALFAIEYALYKLWTSWGVRPRALLGHSLGEYVAAHVAGVFSLADAIRLVARRGRLMQELCEQGAMAHVSCEEEPLRALLSEAKSPLEIASLNGGTQVVVSGRQAELEHFQQHVAGSGIRVEALPVSHAFHSRLVEPVLAGLAEELARVSMSKPSIPLISNLTGLVAGSEVTTVEYWLQHTRQAVLFAKGFETLQGVGVDVLLEIGPKPTLLSLARGLSQDENVGWLASLRPGRPERAQMLHALAELHVRGADIDWLTLYPPASARKLSLPTYPFQRKRFWVEPELAAVAPEVVRATATSPAAGARRLWVAGTELVLELQVDGVGHAFVNDHVVFGDPVVPATLYLDLALQACEQLATGRPATLQDVIVHRPLRFDASSPSTLQVVVSRDDQGQLRFTVQSRNADNANPVTWTEHARGRMAVASDSGAGNRLIDASLDSATAMDGSALRAQFVTRGLDYGRAFQSIQSLHYGALSAQAVLVAPHELTSDHVSRIHPALFDAVLQVVAACGEYQQATGVFVPIGFGAVRLFAQGTFPQKLKVVAALAPGAADADVRQADIAVFSEQGSLLLEVDGMTLHRLQRSAWQPQTESGRSVPRLQYTPTWLLSEASTDAPLIEDTWLLIGEGELADALASKLEQARRQTGTVLRIAPRELSTVQSVLDRAGSAVRGVIHLVEPLPADETSTGSAVQSQALGGCVDALQVANALQRASHLHKQCTLWLVTRGAAQLADDPQAGEPVLAPVWGLGRTISSEYSDFFCINVDLSTASSARANADELFFELARTDGEREVALHKARRVARLRETEADLLAVPAQQELQVCADAAGLIAGLRLEPIAESTCGATDIQVRVEAAGLNFRDVLCSLGRMPARPGGLGGECSGRVVAVGSAVTRIRVGDRVMVVADGSFRTTIVVDESRAVVMMDDWSFEAAATIPVAFLTAYYALGVLAPLLRGQRVLIHAGAGGVGMAAIQLAQRAGAEVFATASPRKWSVLERLGVKHVLSSRTTDFAEYIKTATERKGVDVVLNALTGDFVSASLSVLRENGIFLEMGKTDLWTPARVAAVHRSARYVPFDVGTLTPREIAGIFERLQPRFESRELVPLPYSAFSVRSARQAFHYMAQAQHVGKVVLRMRPASPPALPSDATYLITGGVGGLGLEIAKWLVGRGARNLLLLGRRSADEQVQTSLRQFEERGATARYVACDVADSVALARAVSLAGSELPPLRGVVHAAGVLDDAPLAELDAERFDRVWSPKVAGAWNLHRLTELGQLDFFVLFSSVSAVLGSPGQGNYAAANAFLDGLAKYRRARGLPAVSVNWGAWSGAGMAASVDDRTRRRWAAQGQGFLALDHALEAFGEACDGPDAQRAVVAMDWAKYALDQSRRLPSLLRSLVATASGQKAAGSQAVAESRSTPVPTRRLVADTLRKVLGSAEGDVLPPDVPLRELGMDSLMAMELRNELNARTGLRLPATLVFDHPTLERLTSHMISELAAGEAGTAKALPTSRKSQTTAASPQARSSLDQAARMENELAAIEEFLHE